MQRVVVGGGLVLGLLLAAYIAKFLLFPAVVLGLGLLLAFMVGDWVLYIVNHWPEIQKMIKEAWNS